MPFTFAHPALILPFTRLPRKWFSLTGLVLGSLAPDFEYFIRMRIQSDFSHTIGGLFGIDLPLGIILAFIFHNIVRDPLIQNLPKKLKVRTPPFNKWNWNAHFKTNWLVVCVSILLGAATHIFWDSFTHSTGYFVQLIPFLQNSMHLFKLDFPLYKVAQHLSTLMGGLVILWVIFKQPVREVKTKEFQWKYWFVCTGIFLIVMVIRLYQGLGMTEYGNLVVTAISAVLIGFILSPLILGFKMGSSDVG